MKIKSPLTYLSTLALAILTPLAGYSYCPEQQKTGWDFRDDILYWTAHQSGLAYTNKPADVLVTNNFTTNSLTEPNFEWDYGFRLALGYTICDKSWTFDTAWIHMESKAHGKAQYNSAAPDFQGIFPVWSIGPDTLAGDYVSAASLRWHLHTDIVDVNAQYNFYWGECFLVKPFFGVRLAMLRQKLDARYSGGAFFSGTDENYVRERFYGAGPRAGIDGSYYLTYGFSLFAGGAIDPLYGRFNTSHHEYYLGNQRFDANRHSNHFVLGVDYAAGIKWHGTVCESWPEVTLSASWEGHSFYYLNRLQRSQYDFFKHNRELSLYGLTLSASFDF